MDKEQAVTFLEKGQPIQAVEFTPEKKDPEHRKYLLLAYFVNDDVYEDNIFYIAHGRSECYEKIKELSDYIDINKSIIILEGKRCLVEGEYVTVEQFLRHLRDNSILDEFDERIDDLLAEEGM